MERVAYPSGPVKRGSCVEPLEVANFVASRHQPEHRDEARQVAFLVAAEWRARYGHRDFAEPFSVACTAAFRRVSLALRRQAAAVAASEGALTGRVKNAGHIFSAEPITWHEDGEERFGTTTAAMEVGLAGERERMVRAARLLKRLDERERKLIVSVMGADRRLDLHAVARRAKLPPLTVRSILRRLVRAVGNDPVVSHVRLMLGDA